MIIENINLNKQKKRNGNKNSEQILSSQPILWGVGYFTEMDHLAVRQKTSLNVFFCLCDLRKIYDLRPMTIWNQGQKITNSAQYKYIPTYAFQDHLWAQAYVW